MVSVSDGDTITMLSSDKRQDKIGLHGIDSPESKQAYGARAKQVLSEFVFGKSVRVDVSSTDRCGRSIGRVFLDQV